MTSIEARKTLREGFKLFFSGATVKFANEKNLVKPTGPLVNITVLSEQRAFSPPEAMVDGHPVAYCPVSMNIQVDLFTNGSDVQAGDGMLFSSVDTSMADLAQFCAFVLSPYFTVWCDGKNAALLPAGIVRNATALMSGTTYQYRAVTEMTFNYTEKQIGYAGILDSSSIKHSGGGTEDDDPDVYIEPEFTPSASGGGSEDLAQENSGFFNEAEIKEESYDGQQP